MALTWLHISLLFLLGHTYGEDVSYDPNDPCRNFVEVQDPWRQPDSGASTDHCDDENVLPSNTWYRFVLGGESAIIPTLCIQDESCGAVVPFHVEYDGDYPPQIGQNVSAWLCGSYNVLGTLDCCVLRQPVQVKRCSPDIVIYKVSQPQSRCPVSICVQKISETIPSEFVAKSGDLPRSRRLVSTEISTGSTEADVPSSNMAEETTTQEVFTRTLNHFDDVINSSLNPQSTSDSSVNTRSSQSTINVTDASTVITITSSQSFGESSSPLAGGSSSSLNTIKADNGSSEVKDTDHTIHVFTAIQDQATGYTGITAPSQEAVMPQTTQLHSVIEEQSSTHFTTVSANKTGERWQTRVDGISQIPTDLTTNIFLSNFPLETTTFKEQIDERIRFVLKGQIEEVVFRKHLMDFANSHQQLLIGNSLLGNTTLEHVEVNSTMLKDITVLDVILFYPDNNNIIPAKTILPVMKGTNFTQWLFSETSLTVLNICKASEACDDAMDGDSRRYMEHDTSSLFERNQAVFIVIIILSALCLLTLFFFLLYIRCSKRGTWVLTPEHEEKHVGSHPAVENPLTDVDIMQEEREAETALTANGDKMTHDLYSGDEDNGWVVPLDEGINTHELAQKTEDTHF